MLVAAFYFSKQMFTAPLHLNYSKRLMFFGMPLSAIFEARQRYVVESTVLVKKTLNCL